MVSFIEGMREPLNRLLVSWKLPRIQQEDGFWQNAVLPLLKRRLDARKYKRSGGHGNDRFQRIKTAVELADIAGRFTELRRSGSLLRGLCPLHQEKTPSFFVDPSRQRWRCFGACARGGDVVELTRLLLEMGRW